MWPPPTEPSSGWGFWRRTLRGAEGSLGTLKRPSSICTSAEDKGASGNRWIQVLRWDHWPEMVNLNAIQRDTSRHYVSVDGNAWYPYETWPKTDTGIWPSYLGLSESAEVRGARAIALWEAANAIQTVGNPSGKTIRVLQHSIVMLKRERGRTENLSIKRDSRLIQMQDVGLFGSWFKQAGSK